MDIEPIDDFMDTLQLLANPRFRKNLADLEKK